MNGRFAILDPAAGMSGDMLLGALVDAGAPAEWLASLPARLGFPELRVEVVRVRRAGIAATRVKVVFPDGRHEGPSPAYVTPHHHHDDHGHHHHAQAGDGQHHHLPDLLTRIERSAVSPAVRRQAAQAFTLLCEEEGRIHGMPAESVALHEVGAADAILDIVGGIEGFEVLGIDQVYSRPVTLGSGWIETSHGVMSVPAPVTARLLEGLEIGPNGPVAGEATTPTGAVLLRVLSAGAPPEHWRAIGTGWGAGSRDPERYPNALRIILAETVQEAGQVVTLSSDLDDLSPEYVDPLREALVAAGALDVQVWGTHMKKGRPGYRVEVICDPSASARVTEAFFLHSTTAGVRRTIAERVTLPRRLLAVPVGDGTTVQVKVLETPAGPRVKAEFDEVRAAAARLGRPALDVARDVESRARALVAAGATGASQSLKEQE
ncbi:MAG TPA: nickel pincer cofactor biosynthesis protein LarC [Gemmatimonadales bacterium]|nr:nickel pincer cofactor biosynthesis protein LarC [Gemmatimonadales bacterium]